MCTQSVWFRIDIIMRAGHDLLSPNGRFCWLRRGGVCPAAAIGVRSYEFRYRTYLMLASFPEW